MIDLTIPDLKLLVELTRKGSFSDLKHALNIKLNGELKDKEGDEEHLRNNCGESIDNRYTHKTICFYYINYNDEYKFRVESMLVNPNKDTYGCAEYEYDECRYVDLGIRKCDVLNTDFLKTLKLAKLFEDDRQERMNIIKEGIK
jgi:hypothetical protein